MSFENSRWFQNCSYSIVVVWSTKKSHYNQHPIFEEKFVELVHWQILTSDGRFSSGFTVWCLHYLKDMSRWFRYFIPARMAITTRGDSTQDWPVVIYNVLFTLSMNFTIELFIRGQGNLEFVVGITIRIELTGDWHCWMFFVVLQDEIISGRPFCRLLTRSFEIRVTRDG